MFMTGAMSGAGLNQIDPEQERLPPPEPTPVAFPTQVSYQAKSWTEKSPPPNFQSLFSTPSKPAHLSRRHLEALNLDVLPACAMQDMIPLAADGTSYFPSLSLDEGADEISRPQADADAATKKRKMLHDRLTEVRLENDLAFRAITRTTAKGVKLPRLAYYRKFWEHLESVALYWDCSLDQYYEIDASSSPDNGNAKRIKTGNESPMYGDEGALKAYNASNLSTSPSNGTTDTVSSTTNSCSIEDSADTVDTPSAQGTALPTNDAQLGTELKRFEAAAEDIRSNMSQGSAFGSDATPPLTPEPEQPPSRMRYKGRRTSTGREMPAQFRVDAVKGFVEGIVWPFECCINPPRGVAVVQFDKLKFPVRETVAINRPPKDRIKARQGWVEGPVMTVQVRSDINFLDDSGKADEEKSRLDLLREVGGLLRLAQERRRESRSEIRPGGGQWWTTVARWGGGPGGEAGNDVGNSDDIVQAAEEILGAYKGSKLQRGVNKSRRRKTPAMLWKELKCPTSLWDPKTEYKAIGKDSKSEYDEVFMVSSLNHHISIVKMTVHGAYVDYLTSGQLPNPLPIDPEWCKPKVQRSYWLDLFDLEQRLEAFQGLWGIMAYLTRDA